MKRKLVKQGTNTLTMSLPASWIKQHKLKNGDEIEVGQIDDKLIISKEYLDCKKKTSIKLLGHNKTFIRENIISMYCQGYDIIEISFSSEKSYQVILKTMKDYLIGFDIVKKEKNHCVIESITEPNIEQFDVIFRKLLYNVSLIISETEKRLKQEIEFKDFKEVMLRIHSYENFCKRLIAKKNPMGEKSVVFSIFLNHIVQSAKEIYHLNKFLREENNVPNLYKILKKFIEFVQEAYFKKDIKEIMKLHELRRKNFNALDFDKEFNKKDRENTTIYHIVVAIRHLFLASNALMGMI